MRKGQIPKINNIRIQKQFFVWDLKGKYVDLKYFSVFFLSFVDMFLISKYKDYHIKGCKQCHTI